jgi:uncharacterized protein involved in exopolysaccharide biosynthesis
MIAAIENRAGRDEGTFDLFELAERLWRGRRTIVVSTVLVTAAFAAAAFIMTPRYRAAAVLVPSGTADRSGSMTQALGSLGGLAAMAGINLTADRTNTAEALAVLRSREFTEGFIADLNLMPVLYASKWDAGAGRWKVPEDGQPTPAQAFKFFDKIRTANEDKKTGLVKVELEWKNREQAAAWVNELVKRLNAVMRARAIARTDAYIGYLEKELQGTTAVETRAAISRLLETRINERMLANVSEEYAFRVVDRALVPDKKDKVRPKRLLMIAAGGVVGGLFGCVLVVLLDAIRARRQARA